MANLGTLLCQYQRLADEAEYHRTRASEAAREAERFARERLFGPLYDAGCVVRYADTRYEYDPARNAILAERLPNAMDIDVPEPDAGATDAA